MPHRSGSRLEQVIENLYSRFSNRGRSPITITQQNVQPANRTPQSFSTDFPGIPGFDPALYNRIQGRLDPRIKDVTTAGLSGVEATQEANRRIIEEQINKLGGVRGQLGNQFRDFSSDVGGLTDIISNIQTSLPTNPYTDELRQQQVGTMRDAIQRELQQNLGRTQQDYSRRGVLASSPALEAEAILRGEATRTSTAGETEILQNQIATNLGANQFRSQLLGNLGLGRAGTELEALKTSGGLTSDLATREAVLGASNITDPMLLGNILGGATQGQFGLENQQKFFDFLNQTAKNMQPNQLNDFINLFGQFLGARGAPAAGGAIGGVSNLLFGQQPQLQF